MNGNHGNNKSSGIDIASLIAIVGLPVLAAGVATFVVFIHQANAFAGFLKGDWKTIFVIILFFEAYITSILSALISMVLGITGAMKLGKRFSVIEGVTITIGTTAIYGWGFWWIMDFLTRIIGLGNEPIPTALAVYLLILPVSQAIIFGGNALWSFAVTYVVEFKKKK
jgi:hypothetical protein